MQVEPPLQDLDGEVLSGASAIRSDGARVDIAVDDFWGDRQRAFWMDGFLIPLLLLIDSPLWPLLPLKGKEKSLQRMNQRGGTWVFLSFGLSSFGGRGMSKEATIYYKRLASLLSEKWTQHYSTINSWLRYFLCPWGARSARGLAIQFVPFVVLLTS